MLLKFEVHARGRVHGQTVELLPSELQDETCSEALLILRAQQLVRAVLLRLDNIIELDPAKGMGESYGHPITD